MRHPANRGGENKRRICEGISGEVASEKPAASGDGWQWREAAMARKQPRKPASAKSEKLKENYRRQLMAAKMKSVIIANRKIMKKAMAKHRRQ
jgi:hypothetical protein